MKKILSLTALGMTALGTTLWAQQQADDGPPPAQAAALGEANRDESLFDASEAAPPAASAGLPSLDDLQPAQPARPSLPNSRAASPSNRSSGGSGRSVGGPARPPRSDLEAAASAYPTPYPSTSQYSPTGSWGANPPVLQPYRGPTTYVPITTPDGQTVYQPVFASPEEQQSASEFRETVEALRKAKTDEDKAEVRTKLNDLVSKQIDQDLAEREKRLTELEAKAKQLRDQLQQRKQTKAEIQKMLVMLIENPQGGLGLPPSWMNAINQPAYAPPAYPPAYSNPAYSYPTLNSLPVQPNRYPASVGRGE